jgi:hypothetical protein
VIAATFYFIHLANTLTFCSTFKMEIITRTYDEIMWECYLRDTERNHIRAVGEPRTWLISTHLLFCHNDDLELWYELTHQADIEKRNRIFPGLIGQELPSIPDEEMDLILNRDAESPEPQSSDYTHSFYSFFSAQWGVRQRDRHSRVVDHYYTMDNMGNYIVRPVENRPPLDALRWALGYHDGSPPLYLIALADFDEDGIPDYDDDALPAVIDPIRRIALTNVSTGPDPL